MSRSSSDVRRWHRWTYVAFEHNLTSYLRQTMTKMSSPSPHHHPHVLLMSSFLQGASICMRSGFFSTVAEQSGSNTPFLLGFVFPWLSALARSQEGQTSQTQMVAVKEAVGPQTVRDSRAFLRYCVSLVIIKLSFGLHGCPQGQPVKTTMLPGLNQRGSCFTDSFQTFS